MTSDMTPSKMTTDLTSNMIFALIFDMIINMTSYMISNMTSDHKAEYNIFVAHVTGYFGSVEINLFQGVLRKVHSFIFPPKISELHKLSLNISRHIDMILTGNEHIVPKSPNIS